MLIALLLACAPPRTLVLVVQGQPMPSGAAALSGPGDTGRAWRALITGEPRPEPYVPMVLPAKMDEQLRLQAPPRARSPWPGSALWSGHRSAALFFVPTTWPIEEQGEGVRLLAGVPDLRGTPGTPTILGSASASEDGLSTLRLLRDGDRYLGKLLGPPIPGTGSGSKELEFTMDRPGRAALFELQGQRESVVEGQPARWMELNLALGPHVVAKSWVRFYAIQAFNELQILVSPLHVDASEPWIPLSWPAEFAGQMAAEHGPFATAQQPYPVAAVKAGHLDCQAFALELETLARERAELVSGRSERLLVLGSVAPHAWAESSCTGDAGELAYESSLESLRAEAGWRDRVVVVGVSPHWVMGVEAGTLSEVSEVFVGEGGG